jgi:hypothetical protein
VVAELGVEGNADASAAFAGNAHDRPWSLRG